MAIESIKYKDYVLMVRQTGPHWGVVIKPTWYPQVLTRARLTAHHAMSL